MLVFNGYLLWLCLYINFWENYTLLTWGLPKKHFTYLGFKKWHFTYLWSNPLAKHYPPLTLQVTLTPIHSKKTIAIESKLFPLKKKLPYTCTLPIPDCDPLYQDKNLKLSASREVGSPIITHVKDVEDFLSLFKPQIRFW